MGSLRDFINHIAPTWLQTGNAEKYLYAYGLGLDFLIEKLYQATKLHIPTIADPSALPYIGLDDGIAQGPNESNANYALRLQNAYDNAKRAGTARGIATDLRGYLSPFSPTMRFVDRTGNWYTWTSDMDPQKVPASVTHGVPPNIDGAGGQYAPSVFDPVGYQKWNYWLVIYANASQQWCSKGANYDSGETYDSNLAYDFAQPQSLFDGVRKIVQARQAANAWCRAIIVVFGAENVILDPTGTLGTDGTWGRPAKTVAGVVVPSRPSTIAYVDGTHTINVSTGFVTTPGLVSAWDPLLPR